MSEVITEEIEVQQPEDTSLDATPGGPIVYTKEEIAAMRQVRTTLLEEHGIEESRVGSGKSALVLLYHMNSCVQYEVFEI